MDTVIDPNIMDKAVLVTAVAGVIIATMVIRQVPTPDEHLSEVKGYLDEMLSLQISTNDAVDAGDYYTACRTQQLVVDLALAHNVSDLGIDIDNLQKLEDSICGTSNKEVI